MLVGRKEPIRKMQHLLTSRKSEFLAITGRRRVGKTYLIDQVYQEHICFRMTGIQNGSLQQQLVNFQYKLSEYAPLPIRSTPTDWQEAFLILKDYLQSLDKKKKHVIFIDELPWVATARSEFLQLLAHLWNDYLAKEKNFILVVCGSSNSWIVDKVINDTGGLHNRVTETIKLQPFSIQESRELLELNGIKLTEQELVKLYMVLGGIPFYLELVRKGENSTTAVERLCFSTDGALKEEYHNLYRALFKNAQNHEAFVEALASSQDGLTHHQIIEKTGIPDGGTYIRTKEDLLLSGFIEERSAFGKKKKDAIYKLVDEFSIFYNRFMKPNKRYTKGMWNQLATTQAYKIWLGYAFETFCYKHITEIKRALGIEAVYTEISTLRVKGDKKRGGFQLDLIIDRMDNTINLCELKFYAAPFSIDKKYGEWLNERKQAFQDETQTKKQLFTTLITSFGLKQNQYSNAYVDVDISLKDMLR